MKRLSESKQTFDETCKNLIERMINTVPKNVTLTDVILPIQNKVGLSEFSTSTDPKEDDLVFTITLRTIDLPDDPNRTVTFFWTDRRASDSSSSCPSSGCLHSAPTTSELIVAAPTFINQGLPFLGYNAVVYSVNATINASTSIDKFWFEISEGQSTQAVAT
ncbi:hypothetical protein D9758_011607 [Tetrapyrgos nigripes]|uniref:Uncharacterized protein n=1 Tax=Tetrapyrgos nigripes TaxID=182062 RepID=A0A8H5CN63_9AGAR|nr:hypothetical protein D9758_011607 [Tetrapyrgos nigripes]